MRRLVVGCLLFLTKAALAAPGTATIQFTGGTSSASQQVHTWGSPQKYVVTGTILDASGAPSLGAARFNADGTLDATFGTGGKVKLSSAFTIAASDVANGKLVLVGRAAATGSPLLVRLNGDDGTLDTSFGSGGIVDAGLGIGEAVDIKISSDNKLVVLVVIDGGQGNRVMRLNWNGTLDSTFGGGDGAVFLPGPTAMNGRKNDAAWDYFSLRLINGKTLVFGAGGPTGQAVIVKYTSTGALDTSFNGSGTLIPPQLPGTTYNAAYWGRPFSDESFIVAGEADDGIYSERYFADGTLDTSYGWVGYNSANLSGTILSSPTGAIDSQGRLLLTATLTRQSDQGHEVVTWRFKPNGGADLTFNSTGYRRTVFNSAKSQDQPYSVIADDADRAIVVGNASGPWGIERITTSGALDTTFGF